MGVFMPSDRLSLSCAVALCVLMLPAPVAASPSAAPPAKPNFSAFHMKPILEPHLTTRKPDPETVQKPAPTRTPAAPNSLGTLTIRAKPPAPAPEPAPARPAYLVAPEGATPVPPAQAAAPPAPETAETAAPVASPPAATPPEDSAYISEGISTAGLPIPIRKPEDPTERTLFERIFEVADEGQGATPVQIHNPDAIDDETPDEAASDNLPELNEAAAIASDSSVIVEDVPEINPAPEAQIRISRFGDEQRMAGYSLNTNRIRPGSLPAAMQDIRIGRLQEARGASPIIIPGLHKAAIPRAPDMPRSVDQTRPEEVILFFEENSNNLEAGQMAVIHTDVIDLLRRRPELKVDIIAYAETSGPDDDPERLSRARALMVRDYLIRNKIDSARIMVTGRANKTKIQPRDRADLFFIR